MNLLLKWMLKGIISPQTTHLTQKVLGRLRSLRKTNMGQKINPQSFRLGIIKDWPVRWFLPDKGGRSTYAKYLAEDEIIRKLIREKLTLSGIASIEIERTINSLKVFIKSARPGFIIGRGGKGIEDFTKALEDT